MLLVIVHPFWSVTVTVYNPDGNPVGFWSVLIDVPAKFVQSYV